jgi:hypothetical protein
MFGLISLSFFASTMARKAVATIVPPRRRD